MVILVIVICMAVAFFAGLILGITVTESYWKDVIKALGQRRIGEPRRHVRSL